jgi:hypothetical protein
VRFGESYVQFTLARGCTSVNMFTFESDDELHQGQRGYTYLRKTTTSVGRWPGSRKLNVGLHVAAKRRPHHAPAQASRPMIDDDEAEARVRALTTVLVLARNSAGRARVWLVRLTIGDGAVQLLCRRASRA